MDTRHKPSKQKCKVAGDPKATVNKSKPVQQLKCLYIMCPGNEFVWCNLFLFDCVWFYCLKAQNYHNTSAGMLTWLLITTNDSGIALPGVGIAGGQASVAGCSSVLEQMLPGHRYFELTFWIAQPQRMLLLLVSHYVLVEQIIKHVFLLRIFID